MASATGSEALCQAKFAKHIFKCDVCRKPCNTLKSYLKHTRLHTSVELTKVLIDQILKFKIYLLILFSFHDIFYVLGRLHKCLVCIRFCRFFMQVYENQRKHLLSKILLQSKSFDLSNENGIFISRKNNLVHTYVIGTYLILTYL